MQRIINNTLYDTEVSDLIYTDAHTHERWFHTKNGAFFIAYQNGQIALISENAVKEVLGREDIPMYIEIFGEPEEG